MFLKRILSSITTIALCASFMLPINTFAAASFTGGTNVNGGLNVAVTIDDLEITGVDEEDIVPVFLYVPAGSLSMTTTVGLTFTGSSSGQRLYFSGTLSDVNTALATLQYTHSSAGTFTLEASIIGAGQIYDPSTQHMYEVVNHGSSITATDARTAALARSINGVSGYLANITSSEENAFVAARITQDGWFGASDAGVEGDWVWLDGPETGLVFWQGTANGTSFGYENWANLEPNQSGNEDCSQFYANGSGWNDLPCSHAGISTYIVEYGAPGNLPNVASDTLDITLSADTTTQAPTLTSPTSNSTQNTLQLTYSLPELPLTQSARVIFHNGTHANTYIIGDTQSVNVPMFLYRGASFFEEPIFYAGVNEDYLLLGAGPWPGTLPDGVYTVTLSYQDYLGNTASTAVATNVVIDTTVEVPTIDTPTEGSTVRSKTIEVTGTCESGATVSIFGDELETSPVEVTCTDGGYSADIIFADDDIGNGASLYVSQVDLAGNESEESAMRNIRYVAKKSSGSTNNEITTAPKQEQTNTQTVELPKKAPHVGDEKPTPENETLKYPLNSAEQESCSTIYPTEFIRLGRKNNPEQVKLLEEFLNTYENANLPVDGHYSLEDFHAVVKWQEKYADDILKPWGISKGTGYVYKKSLSTIQKIIKNNCSKKLQNNDTETPVAKKEEENN